MSTVAALLLFLALGACLLLGMVFHAVESAVLRLNRARLLQLFGRETTEISAERAILRDTKDIYFVARLGLSATLVGAGLCIIALIDGLAMRWFGPADAHREIIQVCAALLIVTPLYLFAVFGVPRLLMRHETADDDYALPPWMVPFLKAVHPLTFLARIGNVLPLARFLPRHQLTKNDLVALVTDLDIDEETATEANSEESNREETSHTPVPVFEEETDEEEIIYNILDLDETLVREVMKPINTVVALRLESATVEMVKQLARRTGYSRFPVFKDRIVNLVGYVSVYDILRGNSEDASLDAFVSPVFFVPEFMRVSRLLQEFLDRRIKAAVVVDEHGGSSGWVTREDVFEEIVGEIEDEFDARRSHIQEISAREWLVDGNMDTDDLAEEIPVTFEDPPYDTVAGFILHTLGEIPETGAVVETDEAVYTVEKMDGHRIARVRVRLRDPQELAEIDQQASSN